MSSPAPSTAIQRPELGGALEQFDLEMSQQGFIGLRVFPVFDTLRQTANIGRIPLAQLLKPGETARGPGAGYGRGNWTFDSFSFACEEHGWEEPVDDRLAEIYRTYFDAETVAAKKARDVVLRNLEKRICDTATSTSTWTGSSLTTAAGTAWSTKATATPIADVLGASIKVRSNCGAAPNAVIMDWEAFMRARECAEVVDRIKYAGFDDPKNISAAALAQAFNVEEVIVAGGGALRNSAKEGQAASLTSLWPKGSVMVGRVARTNDVHEVCIGRTFHYSADGSNIGATMETYRDETKRSNIVRARCDTDELVIYAEAGHLLTGVLS